MQIGNMIEELYVELYTHGMVNAPIFSAHEFCQITHILLLNVES